MLESKKTYYLGFIFAGASDKKPLNVANGFDGLFCSPFYGKIVEIG